MALSAVHIRTRAADATKTTTCRRAGARSSPRAPTPTLPRGSLQSSATGRVLATVALILARIQMVQSRCVPEPSFLTTTIDVLRRITSTICPVVRPRLLRWTRGAGAQPHRQQQHHLWSHGAAARNLRRIGRHTLASTVTTTLSTMVRASSLVCHTLTRFRQPSTSARQIATRLRSARA